MEIKIVIPSHKRSKNLLSKSLVNDPIICVPEDQVEEYRLFNSDVEILAHPSSIKGLPPKKQWIIDTFKNVFMIDDDISGVYRLFLEPGVLGSRLNRDETTQIIRSTASLAKDLGAFLFGFATSSDQRNYDPTSPFRLTGYVTGCAYGVLEGSKLFYHKELIVGEDYFISGINAYYHRYCLKDTRFGFNQKDTMKNIGGLAEFRTRKVEDDKYLFLKRMFGDCIKKTESKGRTNQVEQKNKFNLSLPF